MPSAPQIQCEPGPEHVVDLYDLVREALRRLTATIDDLEGTCRSTHALCACRMYNISTRSFLHGLIKLIAFFCAICRPMRNTLTPPALTTSSGVFQDSMPLCKGTSRKSCA